MIINEPLYSDVCMFPWEKALFQTRSVKRLKYLAHYGAGSLVSPVTHSRFEHTVGVWKLTAWFFHEDRALRAAAILHDIGHLPFSHAVERTLGYNHHELTKKLIQSEEICTILRDNKIRVEDVVACLNQENGLTGTRDIIGLDHVDSFFRDMYMMGGLDRLPKEVLPFMKCTKAGVEADETTCSFIMDCMVNDHQLFLSPLLLAADQLLAKAVHHICETYNDASIHLLTDDELLSVLKQSQIKEVEELLDVLLYRTETLSFSETLIGEGLLLNVKKIYNKAPIYNGKSYVETNDGTMKIRQLQKLEKTYTVKWKR